MNYSFEWLVKIWIKIVRDGKYLYKSSVVILLEQELWTKLYWGNNNNKNNLTTMSLDYVYTYICRYHISLLVGPISTKLCMDFVTHRTIINTCIFLKKCLWYIPVLWIFPFISWKCDVILCFVFALVSHITFKICLPCNLKVNEISSYSPLNRKWRIWKSAAGLFFCHYYYY